MPISPPTTPRTSLMSADSETLREQERQREREQQEELQRQQQQQGMRRDQSASQLSANSIPSKRGMERERSVPDSLNRQLSVSQLRTSRSRTGGTAANIPLSTQQASTLLSPAGERVRAYSDSQSAQEARIANSRQYTEGSPLDAHQEQPEDVTPLSQRKQQRPQLSDMTTNISPPQMGGAERRGSQVAEAEQQQGQQQVNLIAFVNFHSGGKTVTHTHCGTAPNLSSTKAPQLTLSPLLADRLLRAAKSLSCCSWRSGRTASTIWTAPTRPESQAQH